ncbi:GPI ethanolamine phosphate transferase 3-like [Tropilaelaps mercedesae]|uniref:GPI ethanolamine phosphate transferase 3-like n=1 Tax=Tropilaelaps mercedesae TaxID=418985 RepID=A0A1V9XI99_9ACAR|nr:GPI ethanolamine phosphate transferase 3-like [Tropilaelaps mercedesae]
MPVPNLRYGSILFLFFLGAYLFCRGFFLHRNLSTRTSSCGDLRDFYHVQPQGRCWSESRFSRAIVLIIDALKYEFTVTLDDTHAHWANKMPIFEQLRFRYPYATYHARYLADSPTTTLQRLTALMTGGMPTFIDAATNFYQTAIVEDNLIRQMADNGKHIVFLGDDTWMNLLPGAFRRSYPFPSFVVHDLHTVDSGILSHIYDELNKPDIDILIAHFLGVDHCGHWHHQDHPEMASKLRQMNLLVANVSSKLRKGDLLIVLGDHGMTLSGDHGGDTEEETTAALFMYAPGNGVGKKGDVTPFVRHVELEEPKVSQIDLVPTLSLLLGLPIPFSSLGRLIEPLFISRPPRGDELIPLWINVQQVQRYVNASGHLLKQMPHTHKAHQLNRLWDVLAVNFNDSLSATSLHRAATKYLSQVQAVARSAFTVFNIPFTGLGLLHLSLAAFIAVLSARKDTLSINGNSFPLALGDAAEKSLYNWMVVVITAISSLGHFSNSFVINEDQASLYFVQGLAALAAAANRRSWRNLSVITALMLSIRIFTPYGWVCRYEQGCQPAAGTQEDTDPLGVTVAVCFVVISVATAIWCVRSSFGATAYSRSISAQIITVLLNIGAFCLVAYWLLHSQQAAKVEAFSDYKKQLPNASALCFSTLQLALVLHRKYAMDRATLRLNYVLLHAIGLVLMLSIYTNPSQVPSLFIATVCLLLMHLSKAVPVELEGALVVALMSNVFFATGHQHTFQQIQWKIGFIGVTGENLVVPGIRIILNTFSGHILIAFLLPSVLRRGLPKSSFVAILLTRMTSQCFACFILRQHLMLWAVFATRLLFAIVEALILILGVTVGRIVCRNSPSWSLSHHMGVFTNGVQQDSLKTKPAASVGINRKKASKSK